MGLNKKRLLPVAAGIGLVSLLAVNAVQTEADEWKIYTFSPVTNAQAEVGTAEHPFRILEIVPNESMGMIGYMIDGCEPISMEKLATSSDAAAQTYYDNLVQTGYVTQSTIVSYSFSDSLPADAQITTTAELGKWVLKMSSVTDDTVGYSEFGYYEKVDTGSYSYSDVDNLFYYVGDGNGTYTWNAVEYYVAVGSGNGSYVREFADGTLQSCTYVPQTGGNYQCTVLADTTGIDRTEQNPDGRYWTCRTEDEFYECWSYGYVNTDAFLTAVFGTNGSQGFVADVVTITPDMLKNENLLLIDEADFIVISAQSHMTDVWDAYNLAGIVRTDAEKVARATSFLGAGGNDLSWEATLRILERMASKAPAAMYLQQSAMYSAGSNCGEYNVGKLYLMLMQYDASVFRNVFIEGNADFTASTYTTADGKETYGGVYAGVTNWNQTTFLTSYGASMMHEATLPGGVTGEVFDTILISDGSANFFQEFMTTSISELVSSNPDAPTASNSEMFDYYAIELGTRPAILSMANGYRYVLLNALEEQARSVEYKDTLRILEIQACNDFIYGSEDWELYYLSIFPWFSGNIDSDVEVTTMTTYQFAGDITDLNSEYDLILIGSSQDASNGVNGYNDAALGKLIYTSVGDIVTNVSTSWTYTVGNATVYGGTSARATKGNDAYQTKARYSGTDITKKKFEELRDFIASGSPVVVDAGLYASDTQVDTTKVDASSYIYRIANYVYGGNASNLVFKTDKNRGYAESEAFKNALLWERCELIFAEDGSGKPMAYSAVTQNGKATVYNANGTVNKQIDVSGVIVSENYNSDTVDGEPVLRYTFTLQGSATSVYGVKLYIDQNGDGIYNNSIKEQKELAAAGTTTSNLNSTLSSEEANTDRITLWDMDSQTVVSTNSLLAGHTYQLIYRVRSTERGITPWKLEVFDIANSSVRSMETGYTAFKVSGDSEEKVQINILQMNLMPSMTDDKTPSVNFADVTTETGAKFATYLDAVEDFDVNIEFMKNSDWYSEFGESGSKALTNGYTKERQIARWKEYLENYDMIIIGFCDMTSFTNDEIFYEGFTDFVNQGKSVILSHDLVSDASFKYLYDTLTTENDAAIRTLSGQRQKYYVGDSNYYRYSAEETLGTAISLLPPDDFALYYRDNNTSGRGLGKYDFSSLVETNIPVGADGLTASDATWTDGTTTYKMDYGNDFMDNSTRLMLTYSSANMTKDRVVGNITYGWLGSARTTYIEMANQGQITNYPYALGDVLQVAETHCQNYQLNMEQEDGGDVTVWYNLTDASDSDVTASAANNGVYSSRSGDSANNYYIYTKGNITYTGLGHRSTTMTDDEVKLFVNTMISSYRDVPDVPYVKVTNDDASEHNGVYTIYVVLTGAESVDDMVDVDLSIIDENDYNITSIRSYKLSYMDESGSMVTSELETVAPTGSTLVYREAEDCYQVQRNGSYTVKVPCQTVIEEGEAVYYLNVSSSYYAGTKEYTTSKTTKVVVYAMPLFSLH